MTVGNVEELLKTVFVWAKKTERQEIRYIKVVFLDHIVMIGNVNNDTLLWCSWILPIYFHAIFF